MVSVCVCGNDDQLTIRRELGWCGVLFGSHFAFPDDMAKASWGVIIIIIIICSGAHSTNSRLSRRICVYMMHLRRIKACVFFFAPKGDADSFNMFTVRAVNTF